MWVDFLAWRLLYFSGWIDQIPEFVLFLPKNTPIFEDYGNISQLNSWENNLAIFQKQKLSKR